MGNYYYMMAGAPDLEMNKPMVGSLSDFKAQCEEALSYTDKKLLSYFFLRYDCENIVKLLKDPEAEIDERGNYTRVQYTDLITSAQEMNFNVHRYPTFLSEFARNYAYNKDTEGFFAEDVMLGLYYEYASKCPNKMMARWYQLVRDIQNILTAMIARKQGWNVADYLQGNTPINDMIRTNQAKDFGLTTEYDFVKDLLKVEEEKDPVKKERFIDALKWLWLEDETCMDPFSIEAVFAYLCKLEMLERWERLSPEEGKAAFEGIINQLRNEVRVPEEFKVK